MLHLIVFSHVSYYILGVLYTMHTVYIRVVMIHKHDV